MERKKKSAFGITLILTNLVCFISNVLGQENQQLQIFYTMPESSERNTPLGNIIEDASLRSLYPSSDIVNSFTFGILQGRYKDNFHVNPDNGDFSSASPLDRESICPFKDHCQVTVDVAIIKPVDYFRVIKINVDIEDINDVTPTFPMDKWVIDVIESTMPVATFVIPPAIDQDSNQYGIKSYFLEPVSDQFQLNVTFNSDHSQDLRLLLTQKLDRETVSSYTRVLKAVDGDTPAKTGTMHIEINVVDHNDNSPVFEKEVYNITVAENYPAGMSIVTIHARDWDTGLNGQVRYHLSAQSVALFGDVFEVDPVNGEIKLKASLDYEQQDLYTLLVEATDRGIGSLTALAKVLVHVQDVNDHKPVITVSGLSTSGKVEISENARIGDPVAHISVEDLDKGISGEVVCESLDPSMILESLNKHTYKLVSHKLFDFEVTKSYDVTIECTDQGKEPLTSSAVITITVVDENDNPPIFGISSYSMTFDENNTIGDVILGVAATDQDSGDNGKITYELSANARDLLEIADNGYIRAKVVLDHEQMPVIKFNVVATDGGSPQLSSSAPVTLTLTDINDESPRFSQPTKPFLTYENQPVGTKIGTVVAQDPDSPPFDDFMFSFDTKMNGHGSFDIGTRSGIITIKKLLDREQVHTHVLKVWAINTAQPRHSSYINVTVVVADKNDNAPLVTFPNNNNRTVQVPANSVNGYIFARILATDADMAENAKLKYSIAGGNNENLFNIDEITGALSVNGKVDRAKNDEFELIIVVEDKGTDPKKAVAVLHVVINSTLLMDQNNRPFTTTPAAHSDNSIISADHKKILIVLGVVTTILVVVLVTAIICIKRRQMLQERDLVQNVYKVEVCPSNDGSDEHAPLGDLRNECKVRVDHPSSLNDSGCVDSGKTHLTLEDLKRMKCLYRDRPDITQHVPTQRPGSPATAPSLSYNVHQPGQPDAPYDGILDLLQRQPNVNQDNESTGSNTDSGRGTSEPTHDLSAGSDSGNRNSTDEFHPGQRLGNMAPVHLYLKDKNGASNNARYQHHHRIPPPSYTDASQRPTHYTFQSPPQKQQPPTLPVKQQPQSKAKTVLNQSPTPVIKAGCSKNNHGSPYLNNLRSLDTFRPSSKASDDVSESCDNVSLASTTSGEYVLQIDNNTFRSVNV